jgi:adenine-specific DNA-methyltransferase
MFSDLCERAEQHRKDAVDALDATTRAQLGQYFTPLQAATLLTSLPRLPQSGSIRILDAGAGSGALTAAFVARVIREAPQLKLEIVAVEMDQHAVPFLELTLLDCKTIAAANGVAIATEVVLGDFIELSTDLLSPHRARLHGFDFVILNPPYRKLAASSSHRKAVAAEGADCPNLYAAFLTLGAQALVDGGQLVAITPRSFANGTYFRQFRKFFLNYVAIDQVHLFESRSSIFGDAGVLQENVIISTTRGTSPKQVTISNSVAHTDTPTSRVAEYSEIVHPKDPDYVVHLSVEHDDAELARQMTARLGVLGNLDVSVSTGKVVDFRMKTHLRENPTDTCAPLVYPGNARSGERFSSKEERRRIVAAVWDPSVYTQPFVAFENHLNVFHANNHGLDRLLAIGLCIWLNSSIVDRLFRIFSGHTQVNAGDLRGLPFPSVSELKELGGDKTEKRPPQELIDTLVAQVLAPKGMAS